MTLYKSECIVFILLLYFLNPSTLYKNFFFFLLTELIKIIPYKFSFLSKQGKVISFALKRILWNQGEYMYSLTPHSFHWFLFSKENGNYPTFFFYPYLYIITHLAPTTTYPTLIINYVNFVYQLSFFFYYNICLLTFKIKLISN